jgi:solute carrier family 25 S-adenosylmethionine transporter 26
MTDNKKTPFWVSLVSGGIAGTTVDICFYPLDTVKTRMQSVEGFWKSGGFRGIYNGLSAAAIGSAPGAALFFVTYDASKIWLESINNPTLQSVPAVVHMTAASLGEVMACLVRVPTEVVKQRMQAGQHHSLRDTVSTTMQREGFAGFYKGFGTTLLREIPFAFIQFPIYEQMKTSIGNYCNREVQSYEAALCGSVAGAFAAAVTTPLDVLKTRLMLNTKVIFG